MTIQLYINSLLEKCRSVKNGSTWMIFLVAILINGCDQYLEVDAPKTELVGTTVFEDDRTVKAVMDGVYSRMVSDLGFASGFANSITVKNGLASDELVANGILDPFYENSVLPSNSELGRYYWEEPYQYIYTVNGLLEGIEVSLGVSEDIRRQLRGEALFVRAFCYFYLLNNFGAVPLLLDTDYQKNIHSSRSSEVDVYEQIIADLRQAETLLGDDFSASSGERVRPNKWSATALLARVYLYTEHWDLADSKASELIGNTSLFELAPDINQVFLKNSSEAIWQLMPVRSYFNTMEGYRFIASSIPVASETVSEGLLNDFESGDLRFTNWLGSVSDGNTTWYYPYKYKVRLSATLEEYSMVLRLGEQYLIRAEARAHLNDLDGALDDLNAIRNRAGLMDSGAVSSEGILQAIYKERRVELFAEWGHRWYDLKRTNLADQVLSNVKPQWRPTAKLYPIPTNEIDHNSNISQNEGY